MQNDKYKIAVGGLLHDIGKPVQRRDRGVNHSKAGEEFLRNIGCNDPEIIEQVRYHHAGEIASGDLKDDSPAYITYIADNIASGADRRRIDNGNSFDPEKPLDSVFNILNGNNGSMSYLPKTMDESEGINYPANSPVFSREIYAKICDDLADCLRGMEYSAEYVNSLLEVIEADCSFIPSSTNKNEIADISLYDHVKITAAVGACIYDYLEEHGITDLKKELYKNADDFYGKKAFLLCSFDVSGIQDFIYSISSVSSGSKGTLKLLRARSFYLEMLCEHYIDTLLSRMELSRANLIYSGGGHGYLLLPNTERAVRSFESLHKELNEWFMDNFKTSLYIAAAYTECSADELMNKNGDYRDIFKRISEKLSEEKSCRYTASEILRLNDDPAQSAERECRICHSSGENVGGDICSMCAKLIEFSNEILDREFFAVVRDKEDGLPLPFGCFLIGTDRAALTNGGLMESGGYVRSYCKNRQYMGKGLATKLWVGDYYTDKEFTELAKKSSGIERVGIIRADVDNLGRAFVSGFDEKYTSLSRTATFSRKLSIFFKNHINTLLRENGYNAVIVYSGGDDVFMVTSWSDAVDAAVTLRDALERFSQGTLTISAGIGMYTPKYPVAAMANESGELEDTSKNAGRNRVTLFSAESGGAERYTFEWDELKNEIIGEKEKALKEYFDASSEHGRNMLYNMLDFLRSADEDNRINIARLAYLLARTEPGEKSSEEEKARHRAFSEKIYKWALNENGKDRSQLITAVYLYVYETRVKKGE